MKFKSCSIKSGNLLNSILDELNERPGRQSTKLYMCNAYLL